MILFCVFLFAFYFSLLNASTPQYLTWCLGKFHYACDFLLLIYSFCSTLSIWLPQAFEFMRDSKKTFCFSDFIMQSYFVKMIGIGSIFTLLIDVKWNLGHYYLILGYGSSIIYFICQHASIVSHIMWCMRKFHFSSGFLLRGSCFSFKHMIAPIFFNLCMIQGKLMPCLCLYNLIFCFVKMTGICWFPPLLDDMWKFGVVFTFLLRLLCN